MDDSLSADDSGRHRRSAQRPTTCSRRPAATATCTPGYAESYVEAGEVRHLRRSGAWLLTRAIPGSDRRDALVGHPLLVCRDWRASPDDLTETAALADVVTVSALTDPLAPVGEDAAAGCLPRRRAHPRPALRGRPGHLLAHPRAPSRGPRGRAARGGRHRGVAQGPPRRLGAHRRRRRAGPPQALTRGAPAAAGVARLRRPHRARRGRAGGHGHRLRQRRRRPPARAWRPASEARSWARRTRSWPPRSRTWSAGVCAGSTWGPRVRPTRLRRRSWPAS